MDFPTSREQNTKILELLKSRLLGGVIKRINAMPTHMKQYIIMIKSIILDKKHRPNCKIKQY